MVLDGICYLVILFCRFRLSRLMLPPRIQSLTSTLVSGKYLGLSTSTFVLFVSPLCCAIDDTLFITYLQDSQPFAIARVYLHTSVLRAEVTLRCLETGARLSPGAMVPFVMMKLRLINPRWRTYIEWLKDSLKKWTGNWTRLWRR